MANNLIFLLKACFKARLIDFNFTFYGFVNLPSVRLDKSLHMFLVF